MNKRIKKKIRKHKNYFHAVVVLSLIHENLLLVYKKAQESTGKINLMPKRYRYWCKKNNFHKRDIRNINKKCSAICEDKHYKNIRFGWRMENRFSPKEEN